MDAAGPGDEPDGAHSVGGDDRAGAGGAGDLSLLARRTDADTADWPVLRDAAVHDFDLRAGALLQLAQLPRAFHRAGPDADRAECAQHVWRAGGRTDAGRQAGGAGLW